MRPYKQDKKFTLTHQQYTYNKVQQGYILLNRYQIIKKLGFGSYGVVFKAKDLNKIHESFVAVKIIDMKKICLQYPKQAQYMKKLAQNQIQNMKKINSQHVVKYYQSLINHENTLKVIIMQFCQGPTLQEFILQLRKQKKGYQQQSSLKHLYQIAQGLYDLYSNNIMHRDLHPGNIMLHNNKWVIIDLGFSKFVQMRDKIQQSTILGNPITMAPEIIDQDHKYGFRVDVWSLGVILYFMLTAGRYPFKLKIQNADSEQVHNHMRQVLQRQFVKYETQKSYLSRSKVKESTRIFLSNLLQFYQQKRYNIKQVINHEIFNAIRSKNEMIDQNQQQEKKKLYTGQQYLKHETKMEQ